MNKLKSFKNFVSAEMEKRKIRLFDIVITILMWTAFGTLLYNTINCLPTYTDKTEFTALTLLFLFLCIITTLLVLWVPKNNKEKENNDNDSGTK